MMKKGLFFTAASAVALSAVAVAPISADAASPNGVYDTAANKYYSVVQFQKMTSTEKASLLTKPSVYFVVGAKVIPASAALGSNADINRAAVDKANFTAANLDAIYAGTITAPGELKVESVSAINAKQLVIQFSQPVDFDSVIDDQGTSTGADDKALAGVFTLTETITNNTNAVRLDNALASLSRDGKTLTLTLDGTEILEGEYSFTIKDTVVSEDGTKKLNAHASKLVGPKDTTAPTVKSLVYNPGTNEFEVELSEPAEVAPVITIGNGAPTSPARANATATKFFYSNNVSQGETVTARVTGAIDAKNNLMETYTKSIKIDREESAIQVTEVTQRSSNQLLVKFDKSISGSSIASSALTVLRNGEAISTFTATKFAGDTTGRTFLVEFTGGTAPHYEIYPANQNTAKLTLVFAENAIIDVFGNTNDEITKTVTVSKDLVAPVVTSQILSANGTALELRFDEEIDMVGANLNTIQIRRNGVDVTSEFTPATADGTKSVLSFVTTGSTNVLDGNYTILIPADQIKDAHDNQNSAITSKTIAVSGNQDAVQAEVVIAQNGTNSFTVEFVEDASAGTLVPVKVSDSALKLSAYSLDGVALPAGTDIYFSDSDKDTVIITLPNNSVNYTSATSSLRVLNVTDANGVKVLPTTDTVTVTDNVAPVLTAASITGNVLTFTFSENVDSSTVNAITDLSDLLAEFEIKGGSVALTDGTASSGTVGAVTPSVDGKVVTFTIAGNDSNWNTVKLSSKLTVKTLDNGSITDENGVVLKGNTTVNVVKK